MQTNKICSYCGERLATDREHVFPSNLYPASKSCSQVQRLTIPSCKECNNGWSDDEVHFRNVLALAGEPNEDWKINGRYQNEKLDDILKGLSFVYGIKYTINGKNVTLNLI